MPQEHSTSPMWLYWRVTTQVRTVPKEETAQRTRTKYELFRILLVVRSANHYLEHCKKWGKVSDTGEASLLNLMLDKIKEIWKLCTSVNFRLCVGWKCGNPTVIDNSLGKMPCWLSFKMDDKDGNPSTVNIAKSDVEKCERKLTAKGYTPVIENQQKTQKSHLSQAS